MNIGDIVTRNSYHHDILFYIEGLTDTTAILSGVYHRLLADAPLEDLCVSQAESKLPSLPSIVLPAKKDRLVCTNTRGLLSNVLDWYQNWTQPSNGLLSNSSCNVKILHIDGNKRYLKECLAHYRAFGLPVIGLSIEENLQPDHILRLVTEYQPNILVITGHDTLKKSAVSLDDVGSYLNSRYFIDSVRIARTYNTNFNELVIIAGGCKSYYEALMEAGANYASSPKRVLINVTEPASIACKVATTSITRILTMDKVAELLPSGRDGFGGIKTRGQCREDVPDCMR